MSGDEVWLSLCFIPKGLEGFEVRALCTTVTVFQFSQNRIWLCSVILKQEGAKHKVKICHH